MSNLTVQFAQLSTDESKSQTSLIETLMLDAIKRARSDVNNTPEQIINEMRKEYVHKLDDIAINTTTILPDGTVQETMKKISECSSMIKPAAFTTNTSATTLKDQYVLFYGTCVRSIGQGTIDNEISAFQVLPKDVFDALEEVIAIGPRVMSQKDATQFVGANVNIHFKCTDEILMCLIFPHIQVAEQKLKWVQHLLAFRETPQFETLQYTKKKAAIAAAATAAAAATSAVAAAKTTTTTAQKQILRLPQEQFMQPTSTKNTASNAAASGASVIANDAMGKNQQKKTVGYLSLSYDQTELQAQFDADNQQRFQKQKKIASTLSAAAASSSNDKPPAPMVTNPFGILSRNK